MRVCTVDLPQVWFLLPSVFSGLCWNALKTKRLDVWLKDLTWIFLPTDTKSSMTLPTKRENRPWRTSKLFLDFSVWVKMCSNHWSSMAGRLNLPWSVLMDFPILDKLAMSCFPSLRLVFQFVFLLLKTLNRLKISSSRPSLRTFLTMPKSPSLMPETVEVSMPQSMLPLWKTPLTRLVRPTLVRCLFPSLKEAPFLSSASWTNNGLRLNSSSLECLVLSPMLTDPTSFSTSPTWRA